MKSAPDQTAVAASCIKCIAMRSDVGVRRVWSKYGWRTFGDDIAKSHNYVPDRCCLGQQAIAIRQRVIRRHQQNTRPGPFRLSSTPVLTKGTKFFWNGMHKFPRAGTHQIIICLFFDVFNNKNKYYLGKWALKNIRKR